jgi:hypothetical protein
MLLTSRRPLPRHHPLFLLSYRAFRRRSSERLSRIPNTASEPRCDAGLLQKRTRPRTGPEDGAFLFAGPQDVVLLKLVSNGKAGTIVSVSSSSINGGLRLPS